MFHCRCFTVDVSPFCWTSNPNVTHHWMLLSEHLLSRLSCVIRWDRHCVAVQPTWGIVTVGDN